MSGESTGVVLSASTTVASVAILPATGEGTLLQILTLAVIGMGIIVLVSFSASRIYRKLNR